MNCIACGDTLKDTKGFPCHMCVRQGRIRDYGNNYVLRPVKTKSRAETLMEEMLGMARLMAAANRGPAPEATPEQLAEQERRSKAQALIREMRELLD
jgi:hypothetical protein